MLTRTGLLKVLAIISRHPHGWTGASSSACFCNSMRYSKGFASFKSQVWMRLMNRLPTSARFSVL
jgi:hypothetical protein